MTATGRDVLRRCALFLAILLSGGTIYLRRRMIPVFVLLAAILMLTVSRPQGVDVNSLVIRFVNFFAGIALLDMYWTAGALSLHRDLFVILRWLAIQALATVVLAETLGFLFVPLTVQDTEYSTFLLPFTYHAMLDGGTALTRPDGLFSEPGVFQLYLNIYLYLALFVFRSRRHAILAAAAVLSTQSTTASGFRLGSPSSSACSGRLCFPSVSYSAQSCCCRS